MEPSPDAKFYPTQVKAIAKEVLHNELENRLDENNLRDWQEFPDDMELISREIADTIKLECLKTLDLPRYKLIIQVSIGQMKDQGISFTSRSMWDITSDNYAAASFQNAFVWASAVVFGVYTD